MRVADCTVGEARRIVKRWHRHLPDVQGGLFAAKLVDDAGTVIGCAIAGNPPRVWQGTGRLVISRVAVDGTRNACTMLYGAMSRAARALGYAEVWTYTLPEESGASLRAFGFEDMGLTDGGEHGRVSRPRKPAVRPEPKRRWRLVLAPQRFSLQGSTASGRCGVVVGVGDQSEVAHV